MNRNNFFCLLQSFSIPQFFQCVIAQGICGNFHSTMLTFSFLHEIQAFYFSTLFLVIKELSEAWKSFPSLRRLVKNVDLYEDSTIHNSRNKGKIKFVTSNSLHHDSILTAGSNFKLKSSLPRSRTSHLVTCTSMEHWNSSHAHTVYQMLVTHWAKFEPIFLPKSYSNV